MSKINAAKNNLQPRTMRCLRIRKNGSCRAVRIDTYPRQMNRMTKKPNIASAV